MYKDTKQKEEIVLNPELEKYSTEELKEELRKRGILSRREKLTQAVYKRNWCYTRAIVECKDRFYHRGGYYYKVSFSEPLEGSSYIPSSKVIGLACQVKWNEVTNPRPKAGDEVIVRYKKNKHSAPFWMNTASICEVVRDNTD